VPRSSASIVSESFVSVYAACGGDRYVDTHTPVLIVFILLVLA